VGQSQLCDADGVRQCPELHTGGQELRLLGRSGVHGRRTVVDEVLCLHLQCFLLPWLLRSWIGTADNSLPNVVVAATCRMPLSLPPDAHLAPMVPTAEPSPATPAHPDPSAVRQAPLNAHP
jgi:hypothetical protein